VSALRSFDRVLAAVMQALIVGCFVALFVVVGGNIIGRTTTLYSVAWLGEVVEGLFAWLVFFGAAAIWREHGHFRVDWLENHLTAGRSRAGLALVIHCISLGFLGVMTWQGWLLTVRSGASTPILSLPTALFYVAIPVSGALMIGYTLVDVARTLRTLRTGTPAGAVPLDDL